jgi:hypothetical protein
MKNLVNHPGLELRDDAADSLARYERDHGVIQVDSAFRSQATQDKLLYRYAHPASKYDRPPYLYAPANPSKHTKGTAIDTPNAEARAKTMVPYGWRFLYAYDKVHLEYDPAYDHHLPATPSDPQKGKRATIKLGARGQLVGQLQDRLNGAYGFKLTRDQVFGPKLAAAVMAVQRKYHLRVDGVVGSQTWAKIGL